MILNKEKVISNLANKGVIEYLNENKYKKNLEFIDDISLPALVRVSRTSH